MSLFRDLGERVERFKRKVEDVAEDEASHVCRDCGELLYAPRDRCPNCGGEDVVPRDAEAT
ncbi:zinc ribbon domain-containing protein [Salinilacihabitans rarus]|uniref:zinc ribbon domain-containing protein n=1 Tax=Salinilacihabitans rarus TaxID=2961596 RepID=UPI0020C8AB54|nr:zinc ribbon domain-containing protein [Salinilacihabitans rarus]